MADYAEQSLLDQGVSALVREDKEHALRLAVAVLKANLGSPGAALIAGLALRDLGQADAATRAWRLSCALAAGRAPTVLVTACVLLREAGEATDDALHAFADRWGKGSASLDTQAPAPPALTTNKTSLLPKTLQGQPLLDEATRALELAETAWEPDAGEDAVAPHAFFSALSPGALRSLIATLSVRVVDDQDTLIRQDVLSTQAFLLARGEVEARRRASAADTPKRLVRLGPGTLIGEMALVTRAPMSASITTCTPCVLLVLRKAALDTLAQREPAVGKEFAAFCNRRMLQNVVKTSPLFQSLRPEQRQELLGSCSVKSFDTGTKLMTQGEACTGIHVIASGQAAVVHADGGEHMTVEHLVSGQSVGEVALILRRKAEASIVADFPTVTLFLPAEQLMKMVTTNPKLLAQLYKAAIDRDQHLERLIQDEATEADDFVLL